MGGARLGRGGQGGAVQGFELVIQIKAAQPVMVDRIGIGGGDAGPGGEIVIMDLTDQTGVIQHDPRRPKWRRHIAGPVDQLLPHAAIQKGDLCHQSNTSLAASPPNRSAEMRFITPIRVASACPARPARAP